MVTITVASSAQSFRVFPNTSVDALIIPLMTAHTVNLLLLKNPTIRIPAESVRRLLRLARLIFVLRS